MKIIIVAMWALVVGAYTDSVSYKQDIGISSGYGGAYGYAPTPRVLKLDRILPSSVTISSGNDRVYGDVLQSEVINADTKEQSSGIVSSSYGGSYGISTLTNNVNRNLMSGVAVSSGYGGGYGYSLSSSVNVNNAANMQKIMEIPQVMNMDVAMPQEEDSFSSGYSGYGNGISLYSGYSRYPINMGYGFAYASNWLGTI